MEPIQILLAEKVSALIGEGKRFSSERDMARRAIMFGVAGKMESVARSINRVTNKHGDPQLSTLCAIAVAIGVSVPDLLSSDPPSPPLREIIERLVKLDQMGRADPNGPAGTRRELLLQTVGALLSPPATLIGEDEVPPQRRIKG